MTPKLYAADLLSATPVATDEAAPPAAPAPPAPKKERTPAQLASFERARAARAAKAAAVAQLQEDIARKAEADNKILADLAAAAEAKKEARRAKRAAAKTTIPTGFVTPSESCGSEPVAATEAPPAPKRKRAAVRINEEEPPKWFKAYIHSVKSEQAVIAKDPIPKRQLKRESGEVASTLWREPETRDRVNAEAHDQMARMYGTIFAGRRLV